jgi:serine/threonine protein kinase/serine/threonine protein phosphatase PrpC
MTDLEVTFGGCSDRGIKAENEDAFAAFQPAVRVRRTKGVVAVVADGVSSSPGAQQASQTAVTQFIEDYLASPETWSIKTAGARVINALNRWLYHHSRAEAAMLTTFSALIIRSNSAHILHVGDCRIARWRDNTLRPLTREHRAGNTTMLSRALGMDIELDVDYIVEETQRGDVFVLTSDGVHETVPTDVLCRHLQQSGALESTAARIVQEAINLGADDNVTCLLARIDGQPEEELDETLRRLTRQVIPPALEVGAAVDGYRVVRVLHAGTRSHLYLVEAGGAQQRPLVMKVPSENFAEDQDYLERFLREEWIGLRLKHRGIVRFVARPADSRFLYVLMEYISGRTLRQWMHDNPTPPIQEVRRITFDIGVAIRALQRQDMVHRDLKPENIMIDDDGAIHILDLGTVWVGGFDEIAAAPSAPVGSVGYVAPECLSGARATHQADIFSIGVICYEMLTGQLPFKTPLNPRDPASYRDMEYLSASRARPELPQWINLALARAVARNPARRYQAFSEFIKDLTEPNQEMVRRIDSAPVLERDPVLFWRSLSIILLVLLVLSLYVGQS